jgi:hypothetical protein
MDSQTQGSDENTNVLGGRLFPGFEVMFQWEDDSAGPMTHRTLVRFYLTDSDGRQVGPDTCARIFGTVEFLTFICGPSCGRRSSTALGRIARRAEA